MRTYSTARALFSFFEFVACAMVVFGIIAMIAGPGSGSYFFGQGGSWVGMLPGLFMAFWGNIGVVIVQVGRATVDTAEMTGKLLQNSDKHLRIAERQAQAGGPTLQTFPQPEPAASFASQASSHPTPPGMQATVPEQAAPVRRTEVELMRREPEVFGRKPAISSEEYRRVNIRTEEDGHFIGYLRFDSLNKAKAYIDIQRDGSDAGR